MKLKELKRMIAEEYGRYLKEQEDVAVDVNPDVDVDAMGAMDPEGEGEDPEATLRTIYDMLSAYFEGEDDMDDEMGDVDPPADAADTTPDVEPAAPDAELEEFYPSKNATTTSNGEYGAKDYKKATTTRGRTGFGDKGGSLNEIKRMQRLANIIK